MLRLLTAALLIAGLATAASAAGKPDPENTLLLDLKGGRVIIELRPDLAPKHVERVKKLVREKFYDGIKWHRVIEGFMAQSGDPTGTGSGGSPYPDLPAEFTDTVYTRGTVGAARTSDPDSANSQFFICFSDRCRGLTNEYTVWGQVIEGMEFVDQIKRGDPESGLVVGPDVIVKAQIAADAK